MLADGLDANGHGTHCAGSAVGSQVAGAYPWRGLAPDARLAFTDIGSGAAGDLQAREGGMGGRSGGRRAVAGHVHASVRAQPARRSRASPNVVPDPGNGRLVQLGVVHVVII